jgi:arsenite oxidase large subunit
VVNDLGANCVMAYQEPVIKRNPAFKPFANFNAIQGDVTTDAVDRNVVPNYKRTWADIRKVGNGTYKSSVSFKSRRFVA